MKKIISIILATGIVVSFAACCAKNEVEAPTDVETETEITTEEATEEILVNEEVVENEGAEENVSNNNNAANTDPETENEETVENTNLTLGNTILKFFKEKAKEGASIGEIADGISQMDEITFSCISMEVEPGYLAGFNNEITNFTKGVTFAPMIGSIPFVGYILETEDADALIATLKENANLRWNICVEAEEMVTGKVGNKVFFVMCPKTLEEAE